MTKREFLNITHRRTNNKIKEWLKSHTPNNVILRYLWITLSLLIGVIVATVGCATYIVTWLIIDVEYDIKYIEVEIEVLGLSPTEAHEYIKKKEQEFNRLGASQFSTLSAKRGRKIEKALKYLYNIYPATPVVEDDTKHNEVIDKITATAKNNNANQNKIIKSISNVEHKITAIAKNDNAKQNKIIKGVSNIEHKLTTVAEDTQQLDILKNIEGKVDALQQGTDTIVKNTEALVDDNNIKESNQIECDRINEEARARFNEMVKQKDQAAKEQTSSPAPKHFEPKLSIEQVQIIVEYMNDLKLFKVVVTDNDLIKVLMCENMTPLQTTNNRVLARLLDRLCDIGCITTKWQMVARDNYCFISKKGEHISSNDFSTANSNSDEIALHKRRLIEECIAALK